MWSTGGSQRFRLHSDPALELLTSHPSSFYSSRIRGKQVIMESMESAALSIGSTMATDR
eukprot:UN13705